MPNGDNESQQLDGAADSTVLGELREISEKLHSTLHHQPLDPQVIAAAHGKLPEAMNGLDYVIEKTNEAANRTLDLVEDSMPIAATLGTRARSLGEQWVRFRCRELDYEQFKSFSDGLMTFLNDFEVSNKKLSANLSEILLAQEFQDLTGQVIRRVMNDVKSVDEQLCAMAGVKPSTPTDTVPAEHGSSSAARGPVVESSPNETCAVDQTDVDDILSELDL